ncbi:hypothetical protein ONZ45_g15011 [Pleurotus djamor]|nr:hypothetical protein ONZ45_g15011 [Pleurotus djamor]
MDFNHGPWPEYIMRSFFIAGSSTTTSESPFYGSWNRFLNSLFPFDTSFEVHPQYHPSSTSRDTYDFVLTVVIHSTPVFIVQVKPPSDFRFPSKRAGADTQLRERFLDSSPNLKIPVLHAVSAFGTKLAFYKYTKATTVTEPAKIQPYPELTTETAPAEWWCWDLLEAEGAAKFREIIDDVKLMCSDVSLEDFGNGTSKRLIALTSST